jgi:hypothetical protein
MAATGHQTG